MSAPAVLPKGPFTCGAPDCRLTIGHEGPHAVLTPRGTVLLNPGDVVVRTRENMSQTSASLSDPILETQPLPSHEASVEPQGAAATADASPLSVREHMARLVVDASKLGSEVALLKTASDAALAKWRAKRDLLEETTRVLRAYERIRSPKRKVRA